MSTTGLQQKITPKKGNTNLSSLVVVVLVVVSDAAFNNALMSTLIVHHVAGPPRSQTPGDPATKVSPRRRRTLHRRGLEKLALNSGTPGGARKWRKMHLKTPFIAPNCEKQPVSVQTGMSTISGDELILRHLQLRDCVTAYSQGRPHPVNELQQQGQRPLCQSTATAGPSQF